MPDFSMWHPRIESFVDSFCVCQQTSVIRSFFNGLHILTVYSAFSPSCDGAVLTVLGIGFCHTWPISLCIELFVFICVSFACFCFIQHMCCIIVSMVGWTWWDWSLILRAYLPSVLWHWWLGDLTHKNLSPVWPIMCLVNVEPY